MEDMKVTPTDYDFRPAQAVMERYVDGDILSGVSSAVLVGRDLVDLKCIGWADKEAHIPLRVDHIFRVFSNTKLITNCAVLLLFEEGRFQLDEPHREISSTVGEPPGAASRCNFIGRYRVSRPIDHHSPSAESQLGAVRSSISRHDDLRGVQRAQGVRPDHNAG